MSRLYNEEVKERYLETYDNQGTRNTIRNIFMKSADTEETLNKDLYNFSTNDLVDVFKNVNPLSRAVSLSAGRFVKQYITWCIKNGYRDNNDNPLNGVENEWFEQFINKKLKVHYSYEEFLELIEELQNNQDRAYLFLMWHGIIGKSFSEIRSLTFEDVKWDTNEVYVKERDMLIKVDENCIKYLEKAYNEKDYYTWNNETKEFNEPKPLLDSPYIIKNVSSPRSQPGQQINGSVLYTRLSLIKEQFDNLEYLTPNAIKQSGMIHMAVELFKEHGVIRYDQFAEIGEKYDFNKLHANDGQFSYFNTNLMKNFINEQNIKDLYDIDVIIEKR